MDIFELASLCNLEESWVVDSLCESDFSPRTGPEDQKILFPETGTLSTKYKEKENPETLKHFTRFTKAALKHLGITEPASSLWFHGTSRPSPILVPPSQFKYPLKDYNDEDVNRIIGPHFANNLGTSYSDFTNLGRSKHIPGENSEGSIIVGHLIGKPKVYKNETDLNTELGAHISAALSKTGVTGLPTNSKGERLTGLSALRFLTDTGRHLEANTALRSAGASMRQSFNSRGEVPVYHNDIEPGHAAILPSYNRLHWVRTITPSELHDVDKIYYDTM